jgi:hypothetical protein
MILDIAPEFYVEYRRVTRRDPEPIPRIGRLTDDQKHHQGLPTRELDPDLGSSRELEAITQALVPA